MQSIKNSTVNRSTHDSSRSKSNTPALRVIPLGGLHEIGKNTCVFESVSYTHLTLPTNREV